MRTSVFEAVERLFDRFEPRWERLQRGRIGSLLVAAFLLTLGVVELRRRGLLGGPLSALIPASHFFAIEVAFTLLLLFELVTLVLSLARSVANSVGKQLEVFSLVLLRRSFEALTDMPEPLTWHDLRQVVPAMAVDAGGALAIFVLLGLYYRLQRHAPIATDEGERASFVTAKKVICVGLLVGLVLVGTDGLVARLMGGEAPPFFEVCYTVLVFVDVLLVLLSLRASSTYHVVLRNSGFAAATLFMRVALTAPPLLSAPIGLGAALFALALTLAYNAFPRTAAPAT